MEIDLDLTATKKPLRILISSNAHWASTGYGVQCKGLALQLQELGHEVAIHAWYGLQGGAINTGGIMVYPRLRHSFGGDTDVIAKHFAADLVITIQDIWILPEDFADKLPCPWAAWVTIDGEPLAPPIAKRLHGCQFPVAYSQFGYEQMKNAGINHGHFIPLGLEDGYEPEINGRNELRESLGIPEGRFVALMVAANKGYPSRKSYPESLMAFKNFHDQYPDSMIYLHTDMQSPDGLNLFDICDTIGLDRDVVKFTHPDSYLMGMDNEFMKQLYQASDVLLNPAKAEGFGLPIIEAQACGCPVITVDFSAMPEITELGYCTEPLQSEYNPLGHLWAVPSIEAITDALIDCYHNPPADSKRLRVHKLMVKRYNWQGISQVWQDLILDSLQEKRVIDKSAANGSQLAHG